MDSGQGVCVTHAAAGSDVVVLSGGEILVGVHTVIGYRLHTVLCEEEVVLVLVLVHVCIFGCSNPTRRCRLLLGQSGPSQQLCFA